MSVTAVIGFFTFKKLFGSRTDDWVDKLNHGYTVTLMVVFATVISTVQMAGDPIQCWMPAEFSGAWEAYTKTYCWIKNTYYIPIYETLPLDLQYRKETEITYYQWTPLLLLFMAFLFKLPNFLWKIFNTHTGLNIHRMCDLADKTVCAGKDDRKLVIDHLVDFLDNWLSSHHYYQHNFVTRAKTKLSRILCVFCSKRDGKYLCALYVWMKMAYVANVIGMFYMLNSFLGMDYNNLGYEALNNIAQEEAFRESPRFPRVTMCDFQIRQLQNIQMYTVQCVLPINLFNEKIFLFLWFWFFLLATLSSFNLLKWFYILIVRKDNYNFVKKYLKIMDEVKTENERKLCRRFTTNYLREDGCFILRMLVMNSSDMVVIDIVTEMWRKWKEKTFRRSPRDSLSEHADIPYIDEE